MFVKQQVYHTKKQRVKKKSKYKRNVIKQGFFGAGLREIFFLTNFTKDRFTKALLKIDDCSKNGVL